MNAIRTIAPLSFWIAIGLLLHVLEPGGARIVDLRTTLFVALVPWLASFAGRGPSRAFGAFRDALAMGPTAPAASRADSAAVLRQLSNLSFPAAPLSVTVHAVVFGIRVAEQGGDCQSAETVATAASIAWTMLLGYSLSTLVYAPLARRVDEVATSHAADLGA